MQEEKAAIQFWEWFRNNNTSYLFLSEVTADVRGVLLEQLQAQLHQYCHKLFFEVGINEHDDTPELVITAEGNSVLFDKVDYLVQQAPVIDNWRLLALKPPQGVEYNISYEDVDLVPSEIWFVPLNNKQYPEQLGITVYTRNYELIKDNEFLELAVCKMLDTVLGEKSFALDIDFVDIDQLPDDPAAEEMLELEELPGYIQWHKENRTA